MQGCGFAHTWSGTVALTGRQGGAWDGGSGSYGAARPGPASRALAFSFQSSRRICEVAAETDKGRLVLTLVVFGQRW